MTVQDKILRCDFVVMTHDAPIYPAATENLCRKSKGNNLVNHGSCFKYNQQQQNPNCSFFCSQAKINFC